MNESETRAEKIDPLLKAAGWGVVEGSRILREYNINRGRIEGAGRRGKSLTADYVLVYRNTKLAVVEAKADSEPVTEGVAQAKNYASKLQIRFAYSTNGDGIYGMDMVEGKEGDVSTYPGPQELWDRTFGAENEWRDRFSMVPFEDKNGTHPSRYYQDLAVERVLQAITDRRDRILLTLATGTGKTFIAFQIAWKLFKSRWNLSGKATRQPRVLFLADRNILADQAYNAFSAFPENALVRVTPDAIKKAGQVPTNGSVFFTIFQTLVGGEEGGGVEQYYTQYPADFFDIIIIDECHRGGANDESSWREILEYFSPAVQLGLTATPKRKDNVDTYAYFGEPVYVYSLKDGINDGFLTPFRVKQVTTTLDEYVYTPDDTIIEGEVEAGKRYQEEDFNKIIIIKEREKKRVELFMSQINQHEKTIVFCANQEHALAIRDLVSQAHSTGIPNYCQRVTANDGELGEAHLRAFQDNEKTTPVILTTSQKLSTGVDARNVRNIVLLRPVNSMIEFKQIIGRGTRLYDGKDYFTIYDFVKAHNHFNDAEWDGEPEEPVVCTDCGADPCACPKTPKQPCKTCGQLPCQCPPEPCEECGLLDCDCRRTRKAKVKLADGKERTIQHMVATSFWHADGRPMSAAQFLESLFGKLPDFFSDESQLRNIWSDPITRKKLLVGLAEKGFGSQELAAMQQIINAEKSDLYDVLAYVAFASQTRLRVERSLQARRAVSAAYQARQKEFLDYVLDQYVSQGVEELEPDKLSKLIALKYNNSLADGIQDLGGDVDQIRSMFIEFQAHLYAPAEAI